MKCINLAGLLLATLFWAAESNATLLLIAAEQTESFSFSNANDFSGARYHRNIVNTQTAARPGDTGLFTYTFIGGPVSNFVVSGDSHISISELSITSTQATFRRTSIDGQTGTFEIDFDRTANDAPRFTTSIIGGFNVLFHLYDPSITLVSGSPFSISSSIPGDWSNEGFSTGDHALISLNSLWTLDENFVFSDGVTTVSAHIDAYINDGFHDPNLSFMLFGAAVLTVTEPRTDALILVALVIAGFVLRRSNQIALRLA